MFQSIIVLINSLSLNLVYSLQLFHSFDRYVSFIHYLVRFVSFQLFYLSNRYSILILLFLFRVNYFDHTFLYHPQALISSFHIHQS